MYGVYLVDDEYLAVKDLVRRISWLENGFEVVGYSTNAEVACAEIVVGKPDVVFCDLKMPIMDGIELIKRVKAQGVQAEFVILSAYGDFNASRDFFLMNGFDYLLKPLEQDNASFTLERLGRKLAEKNRGGPHSPVFPGCSVTTQGVALSKNFINLLAYVTENFSKKHTLNDLSCRFNMHPTYICDLFSKHYRATLTMFVTNLRMREAGRLIRETDMPLKEISSFCGYSDYYHFCKVFKTHYGMPPSQHREGGR